MTKISQCNECKIGKGVHCGYYNPLDDSDCPQYTFGEEKKAGCVGIGFSFLSPLFGVILYFLNKKTVSNPNAYLYAALASFILNVLLAIIMKAPS